MKCLVCGDDAEELPSVGVQRAIYCPGCGAYQLSDGLLFMLELSRCSFHIRQTRRRLKEKVARGLEPVLTVGDNDLLRFD